MSQIRKDVDATSDSYPYVTGMGFRNRCHLIFDEFHRDNAASITQHGQVVFIKTDNVPLFFERMMPHIKYNIKIITHNSALGIDSRYLPFLNNYKIIAWYAQNANFEHMRLKSIPLGLANKRWIHGSPEELDNVKTQEIKKEHLLYMNFDLNTNREKRSQVFNTFVEKDYVLYADKKPFKEYLKDLKSCKYALSPPGAGIDCHRIWESLSVGTIPIVERCHNISFYKHLPIMIIDDWNTVTQEFLEDEYEKIIDNRLNLHCMDMDFWIKEIGLLPEARDLPAGVVVPEGCTLHQQDKEPGRS